MPRAANHLRTAVKCQNELTLAILKPDISSHPIRKAKIISEIKAAGFQIIKSGDFHWKRQEAEKFYAEHKGRFFYPRLVDFISSSDLTAMVFEKK